MAQAVVLQQMVGGQHADPFRASDTTKGGALIALGAAASTKQRFRVNGCARVTVRAKGAVAGTVNFTIYPMLADADADDTKGTRSGFDDTGTALPAATAMVTNVENARTLVLSTTDFVEVEFTTAGASSWDPTTANSFIDVEAG